MVNAVTVSLHETYTTTPDEHQTRQDSAHDSLATPASLPGRRYTAHTVNNLVHLFTELDSRETWLAAAQHLNCASTQHPKRKYYLHVRYILHRVDIFMYTIYIKEKRYQTLTLLPNCRLHLTLGTLQVPDTPHFFVLWASHHQTDNSGGGGGGGLRVVL